MLTGLQGYQSCAAAGRSANKATDNRHLGLRPISANLYYGFVCKKPFQAGVRMKIHEYQAKEILRHHGVPVPDGEMVISFDQAETAAKALFATSPVVVVK